MSRGPRIQLNIWPMFDQSGFVCVCDCVCLSACESYLSACSMFPEGGQEAANEKREGRGGRLGGVVKEQRGIRCWIKSEKAAV